MIASKTILAAGAIALVCSSATAMEAGKSTELIQHVEHMATENTPARDIPGAKARLMTSSTGATMTLTTEELQPGHVTTAWWVIITKPMNCEAKPCSPEDVIGRADDVGTQIVYADGVVNSPDGKASFAAYLPQGSVPRGWYGTSFDNPTTAEIHLVLNDHGPLIPELAASMLTSYRGGCRDDSLPPPFPDTAKADGLSGPNGCALIQDAIFMQEAPSQ